MTEHILELPFPYQRADAEDLPTFEIPLEDEPNSGGNMVDDSLNALPPHIAELFRNLAAQVEYAPCEIMEEAQAILSGLQEGRLEYSGINQENGFIELRDVEDSSTVFFHGPHVGALVQFYGPDAVMPQIDGDVGNNAYSETLLNSIEDPSYSNTLLDALGGNREAYENALRNMGTSIAAEAFETIVPGIKHEVPGIAMIHRCFGS